MSDKVVQAVTGLVEPILADLGLELYDLEFSGGTLKVTIDTPAGGPAGVDIDQIALVNRTLGRALDHDDVVPGRYVLEVTSPGLERTLRTPAHFRRETGKAVNIRLVAPVEGRRRVNGELVEATESEITVRLTDSGETVRVPISAIERAKTVFVWAKEPKPNSPEARQMRRRGRDESNAETSENKEGATAP